MNQTRISAALAPPGLGPIQSLRTFGSINNHSLIQHLDMSDKNNFVPGTSLTDSMPSLGSMLKATLCCGYCLRAMQAQVVRCERCSLGLGRLGHDRVIVNYPQAVLIVTDHFRKLLSQEKLYVPWLSHFSWVSIRSRKADSRKTYRTHRGEHPAAESWLREDFQVTPASLVWMMAYWHYSSSTDTALYDWVGYISKRRRLWEGTLVGVYKFRSEDQIRPTQPNQPNPQLIVGRWVYYFV